LHQRFDVQFSVPVTAHQHYRMREMAPRLGDIGRLKACGAEQRQ
jgi:hypothetical protein